MIQVISGGQTGADQGGLAAAKELGILTGGSCPKGWLTEKGPAEELLKSYKLHEAPSAAYSRRTRINVQCSDGTIIFGDIESQGSRLTKRLCDEYSRPWMHLDFIRGETGNVELAASAVRVWLETHPEIVRLNIAGNRESVNPGIFEFVRQVLLKALRWED